MFVRCRRQTGVSIDDDAPILGACAVQCNTTCDGSLMSNGGIAKRLELEDGIPIFQLAAPLRHREDDVQDYAAQENQELYRLYRGKRQARNGIGLITLSVQSVSMSPPDTVWSGST